MKNFKFAFELWWISKIKPTKQFFRPFQRVSSPSSRRSPFKQRDKSLWLLPEINRESLWLKYAPSNNFGLLFRKSHFHKKLYPKNMWHRVIFQRRWYSRSNKKADRTDTADFTEGPLRELSKHSKPPITSPHRPNMSEVVAFVGIPYHRGIFCLGGTWSAISSPKLRDLTRPLILLNWSRRVTGARIEYIFKKGHCLSEVFFRSPLSSDPYILCTISSF